MSDARSTSARLELISLPTSRVRRWASSSLRYEPAGALHESPPVGRRPGTPVRKAAVRPVERSTCSALSAGNSRTLSPVYGLTVAMGLPWAMASASMTPPWESGHLGFPRPDPLTPADSSHATASCGTWVLHANA